MGRIKDALSEATSRLRDRRRKERQRLEDIFDRQTFVSLLVLGNAGKVNETLFIPLLAGAKVRWNIAAAYVAGMLFSLFIAVYWRELSKSASNAADAASDAVEDATDGNGE